MTPLSGWPMYTVLSRPTAGAPQVYPEGAGPMPQPTPPAAEAPAMRKAPPLFEFDE